jgi:hypothetical protein
MTEKTLEIASIKRRLKSRQGSESSIKTQVNRVSNSFNITKHS